MKLALTSLGVAHRVGWLAVAALLSQGSGTKQFKVDVEGGERRVRHLADFLRNSLQYAGGHSILRDCKDAELTATLLGRVYRPQGPDGPVTSEAGSSELIDRLIGQLGSMADGGARDGLARLVDDPRLEPWRDRLVRARESQRAVHRDVSYIHTDVEQAQRTLDDSTPVIAVDVARPVGGRTEGG